MVKNRKPIVLCVDDDESIGVFVQTILSNKGYEVIYVCSGTQAFSVIEKNIPDIILLDVNMPEADGFAVAQELKSKELTAGIPIIMITAMDDQQTQAQAFLLEVADFISKPIRRGQLVEVVARHAQIMDQETTGRGTIAIGYGVNSHLPTWNESILQKAYKRFLAALATRLSLALSLREELNNCLASNIYTFWEKIGVSAQQIAQEIAAFMQLDFVEEVAELQIRPDVLGISFCQVNSIVPINDPLISNTFLLSNPFQSELIDALKGFVSESDPCRILITEPANIKQLLSKTGKLADSEPAFDLSGVEVIDLEKQLEGRFAEKSILNHTSEEQLNEESEPVILLVNKIIQEAYQAGASDIHIEPWEDRVVVRFRVDGGLYIAYQLKEKNLIKPMVARIKIMSELDITERRLPQDGRIVFKNFVKTKSEFDLRVATSPISHGEKIVMRILDKAKSILPLKDLGFSNRHFATFTDLLKSPHGMILVVGPTGSGKSMTLYAALNQITSPAINIQTIENPIEYSLQGVSQVQIHPKIGLTFETSLRSFLRQDPDVILVGEIRDVETAEIAVGAALTGHLLLSTMHTNDAASTATRFIEMGVEPFTVSSSLRLVCAQRLLRRLCPACKEAYTPDSAEKQLLGLESTSKLVIYRPKGCSKCKNQGFKGRVATHEILVPDNELRKTMVKKGIASDTLKLLAISKGMTTLYWDAVDKVRQGLCSISDVIAKIRPDDRSTCPSWMGGCQEVTTPWKPQIASPTTSSDSIEETAPTLLAQAAQKGVKTSNQIKNSLDNLTMLTGNISQEVTMAKPKNILNTKQPIPIGSIQTIANAKNKAFKLSKEDINVNILQQDYAKNLPGKLEKIKTLWDAIIEKWKVDKLVSVYHVVHSLSGSGGSYGFESISLVALEFENFLKSIDNKPTEKQQNLFNQHFVSLIDVCETAIENVHKKIKTSVHKNELRLHIL